MQSTGEPDTLKALEDFGLISRRREGYDDRREVSRPRSSCRLRRGGRHLRIFRVAARGASLLEQVLAAGLRSRTRSAARRR